MAYRGEYDLKRKSKIQWVTITMLVLFGVIGIVVVILSWDDILQAIQRANWLLLLPSLLFAFVSYLCMSLGLAVICRVFGVRVRLKDLFEIGFVSNVITSLVDIASIGGTSMEFTLMKNKGPTTQDILAPSIFQIYYSSLVLVALIPIGIIDALVSRHASAALSAGAGVAAGLVVIFLALATLIIISATMRSHLFDWMHKTVRAITKHDISQALSDFNGHMERGVTALRQRPRIIVLLAVLTLADWSSQLLSLFFCFRALGESINPGVLITGYSLGLSAGFVSMAPGGLLVQDGSMAGIFTLLGVPIGLASLVAILFRVIYYFVPFFVGLTLYRQILKSNSEDIVTEIEHRD
jgi:uncharacterized protein (TIRG00374 family)